MTLSLRVKKNIFFLGLVSLLTDISSEMVYPLLPLFLANVLGVTIPFIGLIEGIAESAASLMKVVSGWFSDRSGRRKPFVWFGYGLSSVMKPLFALSTAGWQVLFFRFGDRVIDGGQAASLNISHLCLHLVVVRPLQWSHSC